MVNIALMDNVVNALLKPTKLWSRIEVLAIPYPIPNKPGIYADCATMVLQKRSDVPRELIL